jgi:tRNA A-37 threonylcarbamoyl transferase component Bud32
MSIGPGSRLGPYVVQEFIGQGAMGVVYRAYHAELERVAAVKVLQGLATDAESNARFRREAQAIAHMRHPNVLNVFDFGEFEGTPYMIVEYVEGGSLSARIKSSPIDQDSALRYLHGIGAALDYAHSHGIVHRDVKPANVLLGPDDTPILADFGLVKLMQSSSIASLTGVTTGTPAYMAPEQVSGKHVGPAADRYAFAVMAFEMLTGEFPFQEEGVLEVLYAHVHKAPPAPSTRNESVGPRADAVILRGLAKDPNARWESCESFVAALTAALKSPAIGADKTIVMRPSAPALSRVAVAAVPIKSPAFERTAVIGDGAPATAARTKPLAPAAADATVIAPLTQPEDKRRRRRTLLAIGAAVLLLLLLTSGIFVFEAMLPPTLDVSPKIATFGEHVVVTSTHVPRDQTGEIRLESVLHTFPFRADSSGNVSAELAVPYDIATGDHILRICWNGQCRAQTTLRVVAGVADVSPLPGSSPTSSPNSSPGASPNPGSSPTSRPSSGSSPRPNSSPTSNPAPSPKPSPAPSPTPSCWTSGPNLTESPNPVLAGLSVMVSGTNFKPGTITLSYQAGTGAAFAPAGTATAGSNCAFSNKSVNTSPIGGLLTSRPDTVRACDSAGRCAYVSFKAQTVI